MKSKIVTIKPRNLWTKYFHGKMIKEDFEELTLFITRLVPPVIEDFIVIK